MKFFVFLRDDEWHWKLRCAGGQVIATSALGFRTYEEAHEAVDLVQKCCDAFIYDSAGNMLESLAISRFPHLVNM